MAGLLITFEGPEGAGKTTQVAALRRRLGDREVEVHREPGSTELGDRVRELLLHGGAMSPEAEMFLFMAARAELLAQRVLPALERGAVVILDRYHDSTLAYQGARGARTFWPESFPSPDLTVLLRIDPRRGLGRQRFAGKDPDRIESEPDAFHARVAAEYDRLAAAEPGRFLVVDAEQPADDIADRVWERVGRLLPVAAS
ncbi:MAG: dTMP kinase [Candidatus Dormibacteraeota bacterium]|nr:dTMP kinase [Candidatus Dormibacteraeota bacterium]